MFRPKSDKCPLAVRSIAYVSLLSKNILLVQRKQRFLFEKELPSRTDSWCALLLQHSVWQEEHASSQRMIRCMIVILASGKKGEGSGQFGSLPPDSLPGVCGKCSAPVCEWY